MNRNRKMCSVFINHNMMVLVYWLFGRGRGIHVFKSWSIIGTIWICLLAQLFAKPTLASPKPKAAVFGSVPIIDEKGK